MQIILDQVNPHVPVRMILKMLNETSDVGVLDEPSQFWQMFAEKVYDQSFWYLIDNIGTEGIKDPICIDVSLSPEWWENEMYCQLGNGHHRLCAAILLGLPSIPVYFSSDGDCMHWDITDPSEFDEIIDHGYDHEDIEAWGDMVMMGL